MRKRLNVCRKCGRGMPADCTKCVHCNTYTWGALIKQRLFNGTAVALILGGSWYITNKVIEIKNYMENPPIHQFDLNYDIEKFAEANIKNADDFSTNNWLYKFSSGSNGVKGIAAQTISTNVAKLKAPYGSSKMELALIKNKEKEFEAMFQVIGQFDCKKEKKNCQLVVRFDNNPVQNFEYKLAPNGRDDLVFITDKERFLKNLKKSKRLTVTANIFNNGNVRYTFAVNNLVFDLGESESNNEKNKDLLKTDKEVLQ